MSLSLALNNALSGLNVNQKALSVVSQNIANANTPGYSRQIIQQAATYIDSTGTGVRIEDITRNVDKYLQRSLQNQASTVGKNEVITNYMERLQVMLGEPGGKNTLDEYVENFFNAIQSLAETPERISFRETAVDAGINLAQELSFLAEGLEDLRYQADQDISEAVSAINIELKKIDDLNIAINQATALGNSTAGLLDQLDMSLETISSYMDISTYRQENGSVHVYTANGVSLVDDNLYQLRYRPAAGIDSFINDEPMKALEVVRINDNGTDSKERITVISGGVEGEITNILKGGKLLGLQQLRDKAIPDILSQIDNLAAVLRDSFNAIHNDGSSYPGTSELNGTREVTARDKSDWSGTVRIAVLDEEGQPVPSPYPDELGTGIRPLDLDLSFLDSGFGAGQPTVQTIIDEINNHFTPPPVKAVVGNLNNIQLVSDTNTLPDIPPLFTFDFDLDNISKDSAQFFVTGVTVLDDSGADITSVTSTRPQVSLNAANTYVTTTNSSIVRVNASGHDFKNGDVVYLSDPGGPVGGIPATFMTGYFTVTNATDGYFEIDVGVPATATGNQTAVAVPPPTATPKWDEIAAGDKGRIRNEGTITADFSGSPNSGYYDIVVDVGVVPEGGVPDQVTTTKITYRIYNYDTNLLNDRYNNVNVTGGGQRVVGTTSQPSLLAKMVDENGNELAKVNGAYVDGPGYLVIESFDGSHSVAIDELNSKQLGITSTSPTSKGTNRGFSHYFELNNFFESNEPNATGDTVSGSAINLKVEERLVKNANLITLGNLVQTPQSSNPNAAPQYTYERYIGDNGAIQKLAKLGLQEVTFAAAGGLDITKHTFNGYSGEILGYLAANAVSADAEMTDSTILYNGFNERLDAMKGVNIDEELANTIIYQHAYTASARIITVADELFQTLLGLGA